MSGKGFSLHESRKNWVALLLFALILFYGYRFINTDGNSHPIVDNWFKMILLLPFLVFILHKKDIEEGKNNIWKQLTLFKHFRKHN